MGKNISKLILENIDYEAYAKEEEKSKKNYYDRLCGNITTEMRNNFTKLKDIINDGEDKVEYDGFYIPEKFVNIFKNRDMRHHLNQYMDLTIADMFNMIDDNTTIEDVLQGLFDEYESESALSWGDNFLEMLKGSLNESVEVKEEDNILNKVLEEVNARFKETSGSDRDFSDDYMVDAWENEDGIYTIMVEVIWGDWKHDHLYIESIFRDVFKKLNIKYGEDEQVIEENGSDSYSADHIFEFNPNEEFDKTVKYKPDEHTEEMIKFMCKVNNIDCSDEFVEFVKEKDLPGYSGAELKKLKAEFEGKN